MIDHSKEKRLTVRRTSLFVAITSRKRQRPEPSSR